MSFMKKGAREASRKVKKNVQQNINKYMHRFREFSEIAWKLSLLDVELTTHNIDEEVAKLKEHDALDDMGRFLVLGEYGRIKQFNEELVTKQHTNDEKGNNI